MRLELRKRGTEGSGCRIIARKRGIQRSQALSRKLNPVICVVKTSREERGLGKEGRVPDSTGVSKGILPEEKDAKKKTMGERKYL